MEGVVNRNDSANQRRIVTACRKIAMVERARVKTSRLVLVTNQHHSHASAGVEEADAAAFDAPPNLIARRLVHLQPAVGFDAFPPVPSSPGPVTEPPHLPTPPPPCAPRSSPPPPPLPPPP